jgi:hypothetical protein
LPIEGATTGHIIHERNGVFALQKEVGDSSD